MFGLSECSDSVSNGSASTPLCVSASASGAPSQSTSALKASSSRRCAVERPTRKRCSPQTRRLWGMLGAEERADCAGEEGGAQSHTCAGEKGRAGRSQQRQTIMLVYTPCTSRPWHGQQPLWPLPCCAVHYMTEMRWQQCCMHTCTTTKRLWMVGQHAFVRRPTSNAFITLPARPAQSFLKAANATCACRVRIKVHTHLVLLARPA